MKFKLDENLDPGAAHLFRASGHDVATVREQGLSGSPDEFVWNAAAGEGRALVTLDLDFSNPLRFPTFGTPGIVVVHVRRPHLPLIHETIRGALDLFDEGALRGRLWIVEPGRVRQYTPDEEG